ncbi:hypothetical protein DY000_02017202 [Brassica cretica]|uniref:Uncharacterized protein n=1 Tax=Brassica cretica TaxID=69181 RepID=A0ABQ7CUG0_BRACR|nr:hypothetical protein DY000_02017202 [Brassica cretica]
MREFRTHEGYGFPTSGSGSSEGEGMDACAQRWRGGPGGGGEDRCGHGEEEGCKGIEKEAE